MTIFESFSSFLNIALISIGWIGFGAAVVGPLAAFSDETDVFQRIGVIAVSAAFWIVGLPVTYAASGFVGQEIGDVIFTSRFMANAIFGLGAATLVAAIIVDVLVYRFKIYEDRMFKREQGFVAAVERTLMFIGGVGLGAYFLDDAVLFGAFVGGVLGAIYIHFSNKWFLKEFARRAALRPQAAPQLQRQPADLIQQQTEPAATYTAPPRDIASGFDVPPQ